MKVDKRELVAVLAPGAVLALWALGGWGLFMATLEPAERAALGAMLEPRAALLLLGWLVLSGALGWLARAAYLRWVAASARWPEEARVLLATDVQREIRPAGSARDAGAGRGHQPARRQRDDLRADVAEQVREASRGVEQERNRRR
jgi:DNA polymerase-3 subunit epsilon